MAASLTKPSTPTYHRVANRTGFLGLMTKSFLGWADYRDSDHRNLKRRWALSRGSTHPLLNPILTTATFGMLQMELGEQRSQSLRHSLLQKETSNTTKIGKNANVNEGNTVHVKP